MANIRNFKSYLIVEQDGSIITLIEKEHYETVDAPGSTKTKETRSVYYTDGRGEINLRGIEYKSKTKWLGKTLMITEYSYGPFVRRSEPVSTTKISVSPDGMVLTKKFSLVAHSKKEAKEFVEFDAQVVYKRTLN
ncbi:MAG: hypothetical protein ACRD6X_17180 [Pyrinomonadaceae bacterium]